MLPMFVLTIDVFAKDITISEKLFREQVAPSLCHLDSLKGSFDRSPSKIIYYPSREPHDEPQGWSARGIVIISVGKIRAGYLIQLYEAIQRLIELELPEHEVRGKISVFEQS